MMGRVRSADPGSRTAGTRFGVRGKGNRPSSFVLRSCSGFTLLEVMVAVAILAVVLVTLIGVKNRSMKDVGLADRITTATLLANREMTEMLVNKASRPTESETEGQFTEDEFKDFKWKKTIAPITIPTDSGPITITEIKVAVLWDEGSRSQSVELVSYE